MVSDNELIQYSDPDLLIYHIRHRILYLSCLQVHETSNNFLLLAIHTYHGGVVDTKSDVYVNHYTPHAYGGLYLITVKRENVAKNFFN